MRVSDGAISWDDVDGAPVVSLLSHFRMPKIERYTGIGCPKIHLRLYNSVMRAHRLNEAHLIMLFPMSLSELEALRQGPEESNITQIVDRPSENDQINMILKNLQPRFAKYLMGFPYTDFRSLRKKPSGGQRPRDKLVEGGFFTQLSPRPVPQPMPPQFRMDLHCAYHQGLGHDTDRCSALRHAIQDLIDQGLVNLRHPSVTMNPLSAHFTHAVPPPPSDIHHIDFVQNDSIHMMSWDDGLPEPIVLDDGYKVDTMGSQTSTPFNLISDWVPFELTPTAPSGRIAQPPPLIARPFDGAVSHEEVRREDDEILRDALIRALSLIRVKTTTTPEGLIHRMTTDMATCILVIQATKFHLSYWTMTVRAYDNTKREVMGTLMIELLIGPTTFPILFQYRDMFASFEPMLQISHSEDDIFFTRFTFDEVQTLKVGDFCRDLVAISFYQHSNTHEPMEFVATVDHDTPFGLGFVPTEADYRYMARLHQERVKAHLTCTPFDYPVHPYRMSLANYFVRGSEIHPHMRDFSTTNYGVDIEPTGVSGGVVPRDEYWDEMDMSMSQIVDMVQPKSASPFDLFGVSTIELMEDVTVGDDEFEDTFGFIEGASEFVDLPLSFDILLGFVSHSNDVYDSVSMDLSIFKYLFILDIDDEIVQPDSNRESSNHDSDPIDKRVSPAIRDVETIDFGIEDQLRELKIGSPLSIDERDKLIHLLRSYLDVFTWSYEDMSGLNPSIVQHHLPILPHDDFLLPHIDLLVDSTVGHLMLSFMDGFSGYNKILMGLEDMEKIAFITEWGTYCYRVMPFGLKNSGATYQKVVTTLFHDMIHRDVEVYVDDMIKSIKGSIIADHLASLPISEGRPVDDDFPNERFVAMTSLSGWRMSIRLVFSDRHPVTNNIVEYEACILGLETTLELGIRQMELLVGRFDDLRYTHHPRVQNQFVDVLATLASSMDFPTNVVLRPLLIESRFAPAYCCLIGNIEVQDYLPWYHDNYQLLKPGTYPEDATAKDRRALKQLATRFVICGETLYRRSIDEGSRITPFIPSFDLDSEILA
ncbi:hypothetical protein AAG906_004005 [Vitis piasezkii]